MIKFSHANWGNGWKIKAEGNPAELEVAVTRLFNYSVISEVPETFKAGDDSVILDTYPPRLIAGARAMASDDMQHNGVIRHTVRVGKSKWQAIETFRAARIARAILGEKMGAWTNGGNYLPDIHGQGYIDKKASEE